MLKRVMVSRARAYSDNGKPTASEYQVEIVPGESIRIVTERGEYHGAGLDTKVYDRTFKLADQAEYDSYNLSYYGLITKITDRQVWIMERYSDKVHRLDIYTFCWRNYDFHLDEAIARNSAMMQCI